jgi:hypothetical protein
MSDDRFDLELTGLLRDIAGEDAPATLRYRLSRITDRPPRRSWFEAPWRLATAAVAIVAVVALAIFFGPRLPVGPSSSASPGPSGPPSASESPAEPTPTIEPTPSVGPTASPNATATPVSAWTGLDWSPGVVPFPLQPPTGPGQTSTYVAIRDPLFWGGRYAAIGSVTTTGDYCDEVAFFTSADGRHWTMTSRAATASLRCAQYLVGLGDELVAVGRDTNPWSSRDGTTWQSVDSPTWLATTAGMRLVGVAGGPDGIVAVGFDQTTNGPVIVRSTDGRTWARVDLSATFDHAIFRDVVAFDGGFAIAGRDGAPDVLTGSSDPEHPTEPVYVPGIGAPAAWISSEGLTWTAAQVQGTAVPGGQLEQILVGANGLFGVGIATPTANYSGLTLAAWASPDGRSWRMTGQLGSDLPALPALASDGSRIVILGQDPSASQALGGWISTDGVTWSRLAFTGGVAGLPAMSSWGNGSFNSLVRDEVAWVVPSGVIVDDTNASGNQAFWFGTAVGP